MSTSRAACPAASAPGEDVAFPQLGGRPLTWADGEGLGKLHVRAYASRAGATRHITGQIVSLAHTRDRVFVTTSDPSRRHVAVVWR